MENVQNPHSVTVLIKGPSDHAIAQIKDAVRDGLRAVKNTIDDGAVVPGGVGCAWYCGTSSCDVVVSQLWGTCCSALCRTHTGSLCDGVAGAGAFEVACAHHLRTVTKKSLEGRAKLGLETFAEALMGFPKVCVCLCVQGRQKRRDCVTSDIGGVCWLCKNCATQERRCLLRSAACPVCGTAGEIIGSTTTTSQACGACCCCCCGCRCWQTTLGTTRRRPSSPSRRRLSAATWWGWTSPQGSPLIPPQQACWTTTLSRSR